jgi:predicted ATPase
VAHRIGYPQAVDQALNSAAHALLLQRAWEPALENITPALAIAHQQGFHMRDAMARVMQGWALSLRGAGREALAQLAAAVADYRATGARAWQTNFLALLAQAHCSAGLVTDGLQTISEARELSMNQAEHWWDAELSRIEGDLHLASPGSRDGRAEQSYRNAIDTARRQQARSWELRAATCLARLLGEQGRRSEARDLLFPVYGWFTEGFDTADLKDAKALLEELA